MTAQIIDGKRIASELRARVAAEVARVKRDHELTPGLAVVLVGQDPASQVYVRSKHKQTQEAGMASFEHVLPENVAEADLLAFYHPDTLRQISALRAWLLTVMLSSKSCSTRAVRL